MTISTSTAADEKRVLILSASVGAGHVMAARALEEAFGEQECVAHVEHHDALELTNDIFTRMYADGFKGMVKNTPHFLGFWYDATDEPSAINEGRRLMDRLAASRLVELVRRMNADIVACTHFMPGGVVSDLARAGKIDSRVSIVTTDLDYQWAWSVPFVHQISVALPATRFFLESCGIPAQNISVNGIPISPRFLRRVDHEAVRKRYGLRSSGPTILLSAGAASEGPIRTVLEQLLRTTQRPEVVVVCGRDEELRRDALAITSPQAERFVVLGFTEDMPELMQVSDVFIGKPGGLTMSECMASSLPMIIIRPTPGQEERNSDHLLENGAALKCNDLLVLPFKLDGLLGDSERLTRMKEAARRFGRPNAARDTCRALLEYDPPALTLRRRDRRAIYELLRDQ